MYGNVGKHLAAEESRQGYKGYLNGMPNWIYFQGDPKVTNRPADDIDLKLAVLPPDFDCIGQRHE